MRSKKLFSILLSAMLVFTTVFAGTGSVYAESAFPDDAQTVGTSFPDKALMSAAALSDQDATPITAVSLNSSSAATTYRSITYNRQSPVYIPVKIPKAGAFSFSIAAGGNGEAILYGTLEQALSETDPIASAPVYRSYSLEDFDPFHAAVSKAGTYWLVLTTDSYSGVNTYFNCCYAPAGGTPTLGRTFVGTSPKGTNSGWSYYKITTAGLRYLTISFPERYKADSLYQVKLMNSTKKKNLSKGVIGVGSGKEWTTYAAVPKGTYYVAVKSTDTMYGINLKATKVTENSGSTRAKAKSIYKGNTKKGLITATQSSSSGDWYKIKLNKAQVVKLEIVTKTGGYSGGIRVSLYNAGKTKAFGYSNFSWKTPSKTLSPFTSGQGGRLAKGTYYIKVHKNASGSGYYQIKWKA